MKWKKVGGVSLLFKIKFNEFHFCKQYCPVFIMDKHFQEKENKNLGLISVLRPFDTF